jgi:hypothetical protein
VVGYDPRPLTVPGTDLPAPGYYCTRLVKGGVAVAARIWIEEDRDPETGELMADQKWMAEIDGAGAFDCTAVPPRGWPWWPITKAQYDYLVADAAWCRAHAPDDPKAQPLRPVSTTPAPVF